MWPRVDFGNLYRFVASVGLLCVAAAVALPVLVAVQSQGFAIGQSDFDKLEATSQAIYVARARVFSFFLDWWPIGSGALAAIGSLCIWWGVAGWYERQKNTDRRENAETYLAESDVRKATPEERESKLRDDALAALDAEATNAESGESAEESEGPESGDESAAEPNASDGPAEHQRTAVDQASVGGMTDKIRAVHGEVMRILGDVAGDSHLLIQDVAIGDSSNRKSIVDALLSPKFVESARAPMLVEVSYFSSLNGVLARARRVGDRLVQASSGLPSEGVWRPVLLGIFVLELQSSDERVRLVQARARAKLDAVGLQRVNTLFIHEDELYGLDPESFRALLRRSLSRPDWARLRLHGISTW